VVGDILVVAAFVLVGAYAFYRRRRALRAWPECLLENSFGNSIVHHVTTVPLKAEKTLSIGLSARRRFRLLME